mmetsp:Transcript_67089/g.151672  ORF Transcript_67089/g.151672 Transcript_67089/m.151672 type:complete len:204 (-) Transcript_67089:56-667(-)
MGASGGKSSGQVETANPLRGECAAPFSSTQESGAPLTCGGDPSGSKGDIGSLNDWAAGVGGEPSGSDGRGGCGCGGGCGGGGGPIQAPHRQEEVHGRKLLGLGGGTGRPAAGLAGDWTAPEEVSIETSVQLAPKRSMETLAGRMPFAGLVEAAPPYRVVHSGNRRKCGFAGERARSARRHGSTDLFLELIHGIIPLLQQLGSL